MITVSPLIGRGGNDQKAGTACASAIADGWGRHSGTDMATDQDSPAQVPGGRLEALVAGSQAVLALAVAELIKDIPAYIPSTLISWDSSDYQMVLLDCAWFFEEFILLRLSHRPSVGPLGQPWIEFRAIALSDFEGIESFRRHAGLTGTDPEG